MEHPSTQGGLSNVERAVVFAKGVAMGMSDSVPGVSGGTIALIAGIYERLIRAISAFDLTVLKLLRRRELVHAWHHVDGPFLLPLALGMFSGLLLSANTVLYALAYAPILVGSFFIGLVLAALFLLSGEFKLRYALYFLLGAGVVAALGWVQPSTDSVTGLGLFVAGAVAISAMLLPGLSGAFILILLGVYETMLTALVTFDFDKIIFFAAGCLVGLIAFSRLLTWLLGRFHGQSYSVIGGLLLGSLPAIWPWRVPEAAVSAEDAGATMRLVWPADYAASLGVEAHALAALLFVGLGLVVVLLLNRLFISMNSASALKASQKDR